MSAVVRLYSTIVEKRPPSAPFLTSSLVGKELFLI